MKARDLIGRLNWATLGWSSPPDSYLTCRIRTDGAGAQIQAMISVLLFARRFGFAYVHTPFETMEHAPDGDGPGWARAWEKTMNIGDGELTRSDLPDLPLVPVRNCHFIRKRRGVIQILKQCHAYADLHPDDYELILPDLRARYQRSLPASHAAPRTGPLRIALHLRRGDVTASDAGRFTATAQVARQMKDLRSLLQSLAIAHEFEIYSVGEPGDFRELDDLSPAFHLNENAIDTFHRLVAADILLTAKSSFSYVAALLSGGVKLYEPFWHAPLNDWVTIGDGAFDGAKFRRVLEAYMKRRETR
jgi:hypothetical protein